MFCSNTYNKACICQLYPSNILSCMVCFPVYLNINFAYSIMGFCKIIIKNTFSQTYEFFSASRPMRIQVKNWYVSNICKSLLNTRDLDYVGSLWWFYLISSIPQGPYIKRMRFPRLYILRSKITNALENTCFS